MRSNLLDGSIQRQILLLKLVHEMDNRPDFGKKFDNNPDGDVRLWLARVGALMERVGVSEGVKFRSSVGTSVQFWEHSMNSAQIGVREAIETLKLELDLYPEDNIGDVYAAGDTYKFTKDVHAILDEATKDVFVIDPYFDAATFSRLISSNFTLPIRILCNKEASAVVQTAKLFTQETNIKAEVKRTTKAHDRLIILDGVDCWLVGASIKDGGKKPTYLIPVSPDTAGKKIMIYQEMWKSIN